MRLQITDGRGEVAVQDRRARSLRIAEAGRCRVLGPAVQRGGDRARARIGHRSPGAGEDLVRPPAKEERGRAAIDLVEIVAGFGVEKWYGPSAALEAAPAILVSSAQSLHHAVHRDVGRGREFHGRRSLLAEFVVGWLVSARMASIWLTAWFSPSSVPMSRTCPMASWLGTPL